MLTTVALVKSDYLNITESTYDTVITNLLTQASSKIESMCGQPLEAQAVTSYFEGGFGDWLHVKYSVPFTVTSISYRDEPLDSWTAIDSGSYTTQGQWIYNDETFSESYYKLVLSVGYSTIPDDLKHYASELTAAYYKASRHGDNTIGFGSINVSQGGIAISQSVIDVENQIEQKLAKYKYIGL